MPRVSRTGSIGLSDRKHDDHDEDDNHDDYHDDDHDVDHDDDDDHGHDDNDDDDDDDENRSRGRRTSRGRVGHAGHTRLAYKVLSPTNTQIQSALVKQIHKCKVFLLTITQSPLSNKYQPEYKQNIHRQNIAVTCPT